MNFLALFADAKVQPFSQTIKSFFNFFSPLLELNALSENGGKSTTTFQTDKTFFEKYSFSLFLMNFTPFLKAGAKV